MAGAAVVLFCPRRFVIRNALSRILRAATPRIAICGRVFNPKGPTNVSPAFSGVMDIAKASFVQAWRAFGAMTLLFAALFTAFAWLAIARTALMRTNPATIDLGGVVYSFFDMIAASVLAAIVAVLVHRFVILKEINRVSDVTRLAPVIFEFAAVALILQLAFAAWMVFSFALSAASGSAFVTIVVGGAVLFAAIYAGLRIFLIFPAIAVEAPGRSVRSAFRTGAGLIWPLVLAGVLSGLPIALVSMLVRKLIGGSAPFVAALAGVAFEMMIIATSVAIASQLYVWRMRQASTWEAAR